MSVAGKLHSLISLVFGEESSEAKPKAGAVSAREMLLKASTVRECLDAYARAKEGELQDEKVFGHLKRTASSFEAWLTAFQEINQESELGKSIVEPLIAMASSSSHWAGIYRSATDASLRARAMERALSLAGALSDVERFYELVRATGDRSGSEKVLERMAALARTLEEKVRVYDLAGEGSALKEALFGELTSRERNYDDWYELFQEADTGSALERFAAQRAIETAREAGDVANLATLDEISDIPELKASAIGKLGAMTASFEDWLQVRNDYADEAEAIATEKMIEAVETVDQLFEAAEAIGDDEEAQAKLVARLNAMAPDRKDLEGILDEYDSDSFLFIAAVDVLLGQIKTVPRCLKLYMNWDAEEEENEKILKKLFSLATPDQCAIIALVSEEGSTLREWAEERVTDGE